MTEIASFLSSVRIFRELSEAEREQLIGVLTTVELDTGDVLFRQGAEGNELFIVREGRVASTVELPDGQELEIATFTEGDFFGEMSIFDNATRSATCHAKERSRLFRLPGDTFHDLMRNTPEASIKIMYEMLSITTQRLENTSQFLSDMVQWGEEAQKRAVTDQFTGLFNRRFLDQAIEEQVRKAKKDDTPLSIVMLDLDHFNTINNDFGQDVGDEVILSVVPVFNKHFRESDIVSRYGGDEFTILMPHTKPDEAYEICNRICTEVSELDILRGRGGTLDRVTTSQGIAGLNSAVNTVAALKEQADQALYNAKERGRNCVVVSDG
jgi:diguanylate cyclase (GGDEF)-like protein